MPEMNVAIAVKHLSYSYPNGKVALCDINFEMSAGERIGLVGPNGAGKTTLQLHLNGLLPEVIPDSLKGNEDTSILVDGVPITKPHLREIRRKVGLLFQDPDDQLFCPTVLEDVAFGPLNLGLPKEEILRRTTQALKDVGLEGLEQRGTMHLSSGERKRVCLAGLLVCEPTVMVLDEPTSNLDMRARRRFIEILKTCPAAQLIATHDLELVLELCSRVLVLNHGRIQADGPAREILGQNRLMDENGLEVPLSIVYTSR